MALLLWRKRAQGSMALRLRSTDQKLKKASYLTTFATAIDKSRQPK